MNKGRLRKFKTSKLYSGLNDLSITFNNDECHQKMWHQKAEETKLIQEKKQIDKMLQKIVKERMFGNFLSVKTRISTSGYYALDTINREEVNPSRFRHSRIMSRADTSRSKARHSRKLSDALEPIQLYSQTLDTRIRNRPSFQLSKKLHPYENSPTTLTMAGSISTSKKVPVNQPKQLILQKVAEFAQFFRKLSGNSSVIIYDLKVTKEQLLARCEGQMLPEVLEKLMHFFSFPATMGFRQYCNMVQSVINCPLKDIHFFIFRVLDMNRTGNLTISDMFNALQQFPDNSYVETEIYELLNNMKAITQETKQPRIRRKPTVEEVLCTNHELKLEDVRDLVKQENHHLAEINCVRATCYQNSILALEHDVSYRLKQGQIDENRADNNLKVSNNNSNGNVHLEEDGIRLRDYFKIYDNQRPRMFCVFVEILAGLDPQDYE